MTRLIDADALIEILAEMQGRCATKQALVQNSKIWQQVKDMPTVDAVPVRHGKWIKLDMHAHLADHKCTACGQECYVPTCMGEPMYIYCPNCGANMRGEKE